MTTGEKNLSINFKDANGVQYTFRADEPEEFVERIGRVEDSGFPIAVKALLSVFGIDAKVTPTAVAKAVGGTVVDAWDQPSGFAPVPPPVSVPANPTPAAATAGTRMCAHGVMTKREGEGQWGPYKAYYCPTPKGTPDQCKAVYVKKGTPEWDSF